MTVQIRNVAYVCSAPMRLATASKPRHMSLNTQLLRANACGLRTYMAWALCCCAVLRGSHGLQCRKHVQR